jgi:PAS domain S-box-containing protein
MRLRDVSLKWKLLISFLLLSFSGTTTLVIIAFHSQIALIRHGEQASLEAHYQHFLQSILSKRDQALSLASTIAADPSIQEAFARGDRQGILEHLSPTYRDLRERYGVAQLHFHLPDARSFLRVHRPEQYGELMGSYRRTILQAFETQEPVGGLERGDTGYGIRGVVPIKYEGKVIGTVEVGFSFGKPFLEAFKRQYRCDVTLYVSDPAGGADLIPLASTMDEPRTLDTFKLHDFEDQGTPLIWMPLPEREETSGLLGPVRNFSQQVVALVEIDIDRTPILSLLKRSRIIMTLVEIIALLLATMVVWVVVHRFLQPIREMVRGAGEIVSGDRLYMPVRGRDEVGQLARALNNMVGYLEASRQRMNDYARNLEKEVQTRTRDLRKSEEKYRTLVDNVPLMVYQMTPERALTFVNKYCKDLLGVSPSEILHVPGALDRYIHSEDRNIVQKGSQEALASGREWVAYYRLEIPPGRTIYVREHAVPVIDEGGRLLQIDGILVNTSDQKKLQERTLQAEEIKTLGEVSARLAHEIRNPLTSIGGLSRRLMRELSEDQTKRSWAEVIVREVERLERILQMILSFIQPVEILLVPGDLRALMKPLLEGLVLEFKARDRELSWTIAPELPEILMDPDMLSKALENLCRHPLFLMDEGSGLHIDVTYRDDLVQIRLAYPCALLSTDDLDHYFYPYLAKNSLDSALVDLPLSKMVLHKHGGLVHVSHGEGGEIILTATFPPIQEEKPARQPDLL